MCGRYTMNFSLPELLEVFGAEPDAAARAVPLPRFNVAPTEDGLVVVRPGGGAAAERRLSAFRWGLVPWWADDPSIGNRMINARAETVSEKPAFRDAFRERRCLVPAGGFYEWAPPERKGSPRRPHWIHRRDGRPLAFAGLWEAWGPRDDRLRTFTVLTTAAPEWLRPLHDRVPVVLEEEEQERWLEGDAGADALVALLEEHETRPLDVREVSPRVNRSGVDDPVFVEPLERSS